VPRSPFHHVSQNFSRIQPGSGQAYELPCISGLQLLRLANSKFAELLFFLLLRFHRIFQYYNQAGGDVQGQTLKFVIL